MTIIRRTDRGISDPIQQFWFWVNADLLDLQRDFEHGDNEAIFKALAVCARVAIPMPKWVANAYLQGIEPWLNLEVKELGEAFNVSWPKGKSIAAARKNRRLEPRTIYREVVYQSDLHDHPIGNELFDLVARKFGTNKTEVGQRYAFYKDFLKRAHQENA